MSRHLLDADTVSKELSAAEWSVNDIAGSAVSLADSLNLSDVLLARQPTLADYAISTWVNSRNVKSKFTSRDHLSKLCNYITASVTSTVVD